MPSEYDLTFHIFAQMSWQSIGEEGALQIWGIKAIKHLVCDSQYPEFSQGLISTQ